MDNRFLNQKLLINEEKLSNTKFLIVGAGAIGSFFVMGLSKMGAKNITVYDYDKLEDHNFANQMHPISQLNRFKTDSLAFVAKEYGDAIIVPQSKPWEAVEGQDFDVVVSCVDNMDVRAILWDYYSKEGRCKLFLDGRMSALFFRVLGVDFKDPTAVKQATHYVSTLVPQERAAKEPCGAKSIIFTVMLVSGQMLNQVKQWINGEYRATETQFDVYNNVVTNSYHMELKIESFQE